MVRSGPLLPTLDREPLQGPRGLSSSFDFRPLSETPAQGEWTPPAICRSSATFDCFWGCIDHDGWWVMMVNNQYWLMMIMTFNDENEEQKGLLIEHIRLGTEF